MTLADGESTLSGLLERARADAPWLILPLEPRRSDRAQRFSFGSILAQARARAQALCGAGAVAGRTCVLVFDNDAEFVISFFAVQLAGMVAVPWHPPNFTVREQLYGARLTAIAEHCRAQFVLSTRTLGDRIAPAYRGGATLRTVQELDAAGASDGAGTPLAVRPSDVAVIQYTSGSTGSPKAVELTHAAIVANVRSIGEAIAVSARDVVLCWLPMFHDMGLFGSLIASLYWQTPIVLMSPRSFILRPEGWLWAISRFAVTLCPAPNFAYQTCATRVRAEAIAGLDLSSWRVAFNGSEPVQHATVRAFVERYAPYGFARSAMYPVYGMAENVVAACFPRYGEEATFDWIDRKTLVRLDRAEACEPAAASALAVACVGRPLGGQRVRITRAGHTVAEREIGEIEIDGPSKLHGYHRANEATREAVTSDGWLRTGDLGYVVAGQLYVIGRRKNVIKRAGESVHAEDLEADLARLPGLNDGYLAVCGQASASVGTEELVVLIEWRDRDESAASAIKQAVAERCHDLYGITPQRILLLRRGALPRTTSGKVRHAVCKEMLECGEFDDTDPQGAGSKRGAVDLTRDPGSARATAGPDRDRHPGRRLADR